VQRDLGHVGVWPQPRVNVFLGNGVGTPLDEHLQQIEGLACELDLVSTTRDLASGGVEGQVTKRQRHGSNPPLAPAWQAVLSIGDGA
jgi:hypothetical protein